MQHGKDTAAAFQDGMPLGTARDDSSLATGVVVEPYLPSCCVL